MSDLRLFTAISLPTWMVEAIATYQRSQDRLRSGLRWVSPENLHVTTAFYGSVSQVDLPALRAALSLAVSEQAPFDMRFESVVWAPTARRATMIWAELAASPAFAGLAKQAHQAATGLAPEMPAAKPARPHVTMARLREPLAPAPAELPPLTITPDTFTVTELGLYQSVPSPDGPDYHLIANFPLLG
jgi:2'-5' RNA ligase